MKKILLILFSYFFCSGFHAQFIDTSNISEIICPGIKLSNNRDTNSFSGVLIDRNTFLSDVQIFQKIDTITKFLGTSNYKGAFDFKIINANYSELIFKKEGFYDFDFKRKKLSDSLMYFHKFRMILLEDIPSLNFKDCIIDNLKPKNYKSGNLMTFKLNIYDQFEELEIDNLKATIKNNPKVKLEFYVVNLTSESRKTGKKRLKTLKGVLKSNGIPKDNYQIDYKVKSDKTIKNAYIRTQIVSTFD